MPSIKCSVCGHRILPSATLKACTNCGAPLATNQASSTSNTSNSDNIEIPLLKQEQSTILPPSIPLIRQPLPPIPSSPQLPAKRETSLQARQNLTPSQQAPKNRTVTEQGDDDEDDIEIPFTIVTEEEKAQRARTGQTTRQQKQRPVDPPLWLTDKLPFGFPRRPPDIFGTIITVQAQQEIIQTATGLSQLRDALWAMPGDMATKEKENVNVTMLRVRTNDGRQKDARMQGYLRGANISLGDTVSLWGKNRRGMITVHKAFNHTSKAVITTSSMKSSLGFMLLLLLLVIVAFFVFVYQNHIHLPFPGLQ